MLIKSAGITDVGLKREGNEDAYSADDELRFYVVADGMGGHLAGEVASRIAVDLITKTFRQWSLAGASSEDLFGQTDPSLSMYGNYLLSGIRLANRVIHELASSDERYQGMGTTVAALAIFPSLVIAANVGDSRIYLVRDGGLERLSKDHTIVSEQIEMGIVSVEEAESSPLRHILTKNLGSSEEVYPDIFELIPANNDRYILCTDGLTDLVSDDEILDMTAMANSPDHLCRDFVDLVLKRGGHDNTTVISIFLTGIQKKKEGPIRKTGIMVADLWFAIRKGLRKIKP
ncbi:MAG: serine/threonine-protein phosphatase [Deltaproteobacteria bacterium]|nr:serine/threonine-protein phosphatase [Deltaproteobacteria bacterium]MBW1928727.1 serine/threonine-protein phosphatase [Deltaproteobacteria bacterium]MBW2024472.1 serine/threonine-protein phosphatase [Deltaproteobacteria bacterium]MBW2124099.1 serine/threonine-protein phosphatase [Deltaproteobacteria bacterium]